MIGWRKQRSKKDLREGCIDDECAAYDFKTDESSCLPVGEVADITSEGNPETRILMIARISVIYCSSLVSFLNRILIWLKLRSYIILIPTPAPNSRIHNRVIWWYYHKRSLFPIIYQQNEGQCRAHKCFIREQRLCAVCRV